MNVRTLTLKRATKFLDMPGFINFVFPDHTFRLGTFRISISGDGDTWVAAGSHMLFSGYRFRGFMGGSNSPYTHNALKLLAYAIHLHCNPQLIEEEKNTQPCKILTSFFDDALTTLLSQIKRVFRVHDDHDGYFIGHLRVAFTPKRVSAYTPPSILSNTDFKDYRATVKHCLSGKHKIDRFEFQKSEELKDLIVWNAFRLLIFAMHLDNQRRPQPTLAEIRAM